MLRFFVLLLLLPYLLRADIPTGRPPLPASAATELLVVSADQVYFVGSDRHVHGYHYVGGQWRFDSPYHYAVAQGAIPMTARALPVISPNRQNLYYIGTDGLLYVYKITPQHGGRYLYDALPSNTVMQTQGVRAQHSLACAPDGRLYYVGDDDYIHGLVYVNDRWQTFSPAYAAHAQGQDISLQSKVLGNMTLSPDGRHLYFIGNKHLLYQYEVLSLWEYRFAPLSCNASLQTQKITAHAQLSCPDNQRLFYIARNQSRPEIHGAIQMEGVWKTFSPTWSADSLGHSAQRQSPPVHRYHVSPDGNTLVYLGHDHQMHGFSAANIWDFHHFNYPDARMFDVPYWTFFVRQFWRVYPAVGG